MTLSQTVREQFKVVFGENVQFDLPLAPYTSIRIGGPADAVVWPADEMDLQKTLALARDLKLPVFVLGKGSNTLVKDGGLRAVVMSLSKGFKNFGLARENGRHVWVRADGGVPTQQLVRWCAENGYAGFERLAGVPGTVGGNIFMNAGTYLGETAELVEEVRWCDAKGKIQVWPKEKMEFQYRKSALPPSAVVIQAQLKLEKGDPKELEKKIREVFEKRGDSQPVEIPNLGSVFKNPCLPAGRAPKKKAWELVEEAGCRGVRVGGARVSEKHANFIVNEGNARAKDVLILINMIREKVKQAAGILLETEIKVIGED